MPSGTHADDPLPWARAWARAATGADGFWSAGAGAGGGPAAHFRTSAHVGTVLAEALAVLAHETDDRLGRPDRFDLVDVGAGGGELLAALIDAVGPDLRGRLAPVGVDVLPRPRGLDPRVDWRHGSAPASVPEGVRGLLLAHEWLDEVPLDVVELDTAGRVRVVLVRADGTEELGPLLEDADACAAVGVDAAACAAWLARWWPVGSPGERAEVGLARDVAWAACVDRVAAGTALAVDYGHGREARTAGTVAAGTLAGWRDGRPARPVPDGSVNLTAHVAVDAVAAAVGGEVTTQREALRRLGVTSALPPAALATADPAAYADSLVAASQAAELLDPSGLGAFTWVRVDR